MPIDVIDPRNYLLPRKPPPVAPEDMALLKWKDGDDSKSSELVPHRCKGCVGSSSMHESVGSCLLGMLEFIEPGAARNFDVMRRSSDLGLYGCS